MPSTSKRSTTTWSSTLSTVQLIRPPEQPEKLVRVMAGTVPLTGLALGFFVSPWGYLFTAFAGLNILQSAFTGFCPPGDYLSLVDADLSSFDGLGRTFG